MFEGFISLWMTLRPQVAGLSISSKNDRPAVWPWGINLVISIVIVSPPSGRVLIYVHHPKPLSLTPKLLLNLNPNFLRSFLLRILDLINRQERLFGREQQRSGRVHPRSDEETKKPGNVEKIRGSPDVDLGIDGVDETWKKRWDGYEYCQRSSPVLRETRERGINKTEVGQGEGDPRHHKCTDTSRWGHTSRGHQPYTYAQYSNP